MGSIANKIDAKDKKLSEVLSGQRYKIDAFQREYRWQRKHIEALISDLTLSFLNNYQDNDTIEDYVSYDCYYMGPIVLCEDRNELSIVDGQQRLTSFTLLLIYLYHAQLQLGIKTDSSRDLMPYFYVSKAGKKTLVLNVESRKHVIEHLLENPSSIFEDIEQSETDYSVHDGKQIDESVQNIIERYEDITNLFPAEIYIEGKLSIFIEWLLDKVILVEVKAYSMENAYTIFETMNDRGMTLSPTEILKGFLLSKIENESKSDEMNKFWKDRISFLNSQTKLDGDLDFFRAWLRAKYATTIRSKQSGSENEDFELIGTQFNSWVKNNPEKTLLKKPDDYYFFIQSDFNFFSNLYIVIFEYKNVFVEEFEGLYVANFYPIADSLFFPLMLSSVLKIDEDVIINEKIRTVGKFIDCYVNSRTISNKSITQSTIRNPMYELIKSIRNSNLESLREKLFNELDRSSSDLGLLQPLHQMDNWGYYHYFFARILYFLNAFDCDFSELMRSRKQSSLVLFRIFNADERPEIIENGHWELIINSVANFCLVRRHDLQIIETKRKPDSKLYYLIKQGYFPEMDDTKIADYIDFLNSRDSIIRSIASDIWAFELS
ncbi:MAG TPA: DUF262 domain-containing protein [Mucilaginibacter sp.]|nr:DUF262 domain-containing protein [Mucilaginibacter sp.]